MFVGCFVRFYCPKPNQTKPTNAAAAAPAANPLCPFPEQAGAPKTMQHNARKLRNQITNNNNRGSPLRYLPLPQVELRQSIIMLACNRNNCSPKGGLGVGVELERGGGLPLGVDITKEPFRAWVEPCCCCCSCCC